MGYVGLVVGASKGDMLNLGALGGLFGGEQISSQSFKILDTSVIIDGRIADIVETGFLDGTLVIPQFVLRELQLVADSADSLKRNRGRRGLDILQRVQKMTQLNVQILEDDFPTVHEVDMKLIELAKVYNCKIVTNDFNLNKVAQLHGVEVLNINELANALKPVVLPGETMRVFILKEGKEYNQGVAYLDDGTMVVVDNAKKMISRTIDIAVTSVLQTTAGKMIFGRFDDRVHAVHDRTKPFRAAQEPAARAARGRAAGQAAEARGSGVGAGWIEIRMKVSVILPAAGLGTRMGRSVPEKAGTSRKQFMLLDGSPILLHTIRKFASSPAVAEIVVALRAEDIEWVRDLLREENFGKTVRLVEGGDSRQESVENALATLDADTELVAVHDAVRPFIEALRSGKSVRGSRRIRRRDCRNRTGRHRQTGPSQQNPADHSARALDSRPNPASFPFRSAKEAFAKAREDGFAGTDESSLVERLEQVEVSVVPGSDRNIKITKPSDMDLARLFLAEEMAAKVEVGLE